MDSLKQLFSGDKDQLILYDKSGVILFSLYPQLENSNSLLYNLIISSIDISNRFYKDTVHKIIMGEYTVFIFGGTDDEILIAISKKEIGGKLGEIYSNLIY